MNSIKDHHIRSIVLTLTAISVFCIRQKKSREEIKWREQRALANLWPKWEANLSVVNSYQGTAETTECPIFYVQRGTCSTCEYYMGKHPLGRMTDDGKNACCRFLMGPLRGRLADDYPDWLQEHLNKTTKKG